MLKVFLCFVLSISVTSAFAAASGSVVFDPTNYSQTLITAGQAVKQVQETVSGNLIKLRQLQEYYRQGKAIASGDMNELAGVVGGAQLQSQLRDMQGMKQALTNLNGNLDDLEGRYNYTMQLANKYGMTVQEYQDAQSRRVAKSIASAKLEQQANIRVMKNVENSYSQLQKWQDKMPETNTELMQMLNTQMTMLNANNAQVMSYMATANSNALVKKVEAEGRQAGQEAMLANQSADLKNQGNVARDKLLNGLDVGPRRP